MLFAGVSVASEVVLRSTVRRIDHVTYVTSTENEASFIASWNALGFRERNRLRTQRYPADHIVLADEPTDADAWQTMTGLSVSHDPKSPVNEFVRRYGTGVQHVAYAIRPETDMDALYDVLKKNGWNFITPLLDYVDEDLSRLRQIFVAPTLPYGPFIELVQRLPGKGGKPFDNFDTTNIDNLYTGYDDYSKNLLKRH